MTDAMHAFYRNHCLNHIAESQHNSLAVADDALYLLDGSGNETSCIAYPAGTTSEDLDALAHYAYFERKRIWAWLWG